jgi:hypothetical protein
MSEPILLSEVKRQESTWKLVKPHIFMILLLAVSLLVVLFANFYSSQALPITIFSIMLLIPVLIVFKDSLPDSIPAPIRKLLVEESNRPKPSEEERKNFPKTTVKKKQMFFTAAMSMTTILIVAIMTKIYPDLNNTITYQQIIKRKTGLKILSAVVLTCFLGVLVINFQELIDIKIKKNVEN